jgi:hypothetical protein
MKPRLESLPYTAEDEDVWNFVGCFEVFFYGFSLEDLSADQDRRDADRMLRIMTLGCRFCGSNSMCGEVHMPDCIYVTDPSSRRVWLRKGARIIE